MRLDARLNSQSSERPVRLAMQDSQFARCRITTLINETSVRNILLQNDCRVTVCKLCVTGLSRGTSITMFFMWLM